MLVVSLIKIDFFIAGSQIEIIERGTKQMSGNQTQQSVDDNRNKSTTLQKPPNPQNYPK